jgi:hydroxyacyl-ACP dehydratase HTD2-like protein with hotdog domain
MGLLRELNSAPVTLTSAAALAAQVDGWSPGPIERIDQLDLGAAQSLHDLLDGGAAPNRGGPVDPLFHWVYFRSWPRRNSLGPDGHPLSGGFMPPLRDRRRMFAGGRCTFYAPLYFGQPASATSSLAHCEIKRGRSGELLLVTVRTTITQDYRLCIADEQDLVYRSGPPQPMAVSTATRRSDSPAPTSTVDVRSRQRTTFDAVTLFRFSALTANSHRIHYDLPYARDVEGYSGLLVQGPLVVLSMADMLRRANPGKLATLSYRLHRPIFSGESVDISVSESRGETKPNTTSTDGTPIVARATILDPTGELRASADALFRHEMSSRP